jgi:Flp pilus assembly pilin Flp
MRKLGKVVSQALSVAFSHALRTRIVADQHGQDLVEYALIAGFICVGAGAFIPYGITAPISNIFDKIYDLLTNRLSN